MAIAAPRGAVLRAATAALLCSCVDKPVVPPASVPAAAPDVVEFRNRIAALERTEPTSPAILNARLDYADLLIAPGAGACGPGLDLAQFQVDLVARNPATEVMFPDGWGRAADVEYRIHLARSSCSTESSVRARELQLAIEAAQRAGRSYGDAFDYEPMAIAQFNVASAYRAGGRDTDAIQALETAIRMDREFGLREDAQDNYATLLDWRRQPAGPGEVAQLMNDFPSRSTTLEFLWPASDATVTITRTHARVIDEKVIHAQGARTLERQVRAGDDGWLVSYSALVGPFDLGVWPRESAGPQGPPGAFRPTLLEFPSFALTYSGDFKAVTDLAAFASRVTGDVEAAIRERAPKGRRISSLINTELRSAEVSFAPQVIANEVSENYNLETAMWIGATLEQGIHYELIAPMSIPAAPQIVVDHHLDFSFTREVPCMNGTPTRTCVELVIRATPLEEELTTVLHNFQLPDGEAFRYSATTTVRIVTDPQTLQNYVHDTRRYWYVSLSARTPYRVVMESERSVLSSTYR